jgi:hypothetical protein
MYSAPNSILNLTGSFTMELWFNCGAQSDSYPIMVHTNSLYNNPGTFEIGISFGGDTKFRLVNPLTIGSFIISNRSGLTDNNWHNIAIVQNSTANTISLFIDGVLDTSVTGNYSWLYGTYGLNIGDSSYSAGGSQAVSYKGYLSNFRIVGTALYTSNYTVTNTSYTAIANTILLLNMSTSSPFTDSGPNNISFSPSSPNPPVSSILTPVTGIVNPITPCFKEGTKILCLIDDIEVYVPIQNIRKGFLIKTFTSGYKPVYMIGHRKIYNPDDDLRSKNRLYKCTNKAYPTIFEDLVLTGCHSILVDGLTPEQEEQTRQDVGKLYITEAKYRLFTYLDEKAETYDSEGLYEIWHLALENDDYYMNYGIWANGLLVETTSKSFMEKYSGMKLV